MLSPLLPTAGDEPLLSQPRDEELRSPIIMKQLLPTRFSLLLALALLPAVATAETILIPVGQQTATSAVPTPEKGMSMASVEARFGEPAQRFPATGQPPISRWAYEQFVVYFEGDTVIHSVLRFQPKHPPAGQRQP